MPLLVLLVMVQLILCGGLFEVYGRAGLEQASWLVPARWGYGMTAATADLPRFYAPIPSDPLWDHTVGALLANAAVLTGIAVVLVVVTFLLIRRLDPIRRSSRRP